MSYVLNGLVVGGVFMVVVIVIAAIVGQYQLGKHRGVPRDEFIRAFRGANAPDAIPAAVYDYYKSQVISKSFSIAPVDTYEDTLHEGEEDIFDDMQYLARKLGLTIPPQDALKQPTVEIKTMRDAVLWLYSLPKRQAGSQRE
jgi:hypothetical protein